MATETEIERLVVRIVGENMLSEATEEASSSVTDFVSEMRASLQAMQNDLTNLGSTGSESLEAVAESAGTLDEGIAQIEEDLRAFNKLMNEGEVVTRSVQNSTEKYAEEMEKLNELLDNGAISQETFNRASEEAANTLKAAGDELQQFGEKVQEVGTKISLFVTGPIVALGTFATSQFSSMEDGMVALTSAVKSNGHAVQSTIADYSEFASGIQATTTMEDDAVLAILRTAESYNLTGEAAKKATKEAIALATIGKGSAESMIRMTAAMAEGNTKKAMMFARMIPQLRGVKDEAVFVEKYAHLVAAGFDQAEAAAGTLTGQLTQLWNDFGDLNEEIGAVIAEGIMPLIRMAKDLVHWFQSFSPEVKRAIVYLAGITAAIGPLVFGIGTLIIWVGFLTTAMTTLGITSATVAVSMAIAFWPVVVVLGVIALAAVNIALYFSNAAEEAARMAKEANAAKEAIVAAERAEAQANLPKELGPITQRAAEEFARKQMPFAGGAVEASGDFGATEATSRLTDKLRDQIEVFGMSSRQAEIHRLKMDGLTEAELANVVALDAQLTAMENTAKEQQKAIQLALKHKEQMEALGKSLTNQYATPAEKAAEKQAELLKALEAGVINNQTFARGMEAVAKDIEKVEGVHEISFKVVDMDSVIAGTAEAQRRIDAFTNSATMNKKAVGGDYPGMVASSKSDKAAMVALQHKWEKTGGGRQDEAAWITAKGIAKLIEIGQAQLDKEGVELIAADLDS